MWQEIMIAVISGLIGAGGVGGIIIFGLNRMYNRMDRLEKDVTDLEKERIGKLEEKVEFHCSEDQSQKVSSNMKHVNGILSKLFDKVDRLTEESAERRTDMKSLKVLTMQNGEKIDKFNTEQSRQGQAIIANEKFLNNLDGSFQKHKGKEKH